MENGNIEIRLSKKEYMEMDNKGKNKIYLNKLFEVENDIKNFLEKIKIEKEINYHLIGVLSIDSKVKTEENLIISGVMKPVCFVNIKNNIVFVKSLKIITDILDNANKFLNNEVGK